MSDPSHVIICGDWHGNYSWASRQLEIMRQVVPDEDQLFVLHLGDFGVWPGSEFADKMDEMAQRLNLKIMVTPGNHEDYTQIKVMRYWSPDGINSKRGVTVLERGTRWTWHGRTWLSVGGAASADRVFRIPGLSWWPEEELTDDQVGHVIADGHADVLLTHDVGSVVPLDLGKWPLAWGEKARRACESHRQRLDWLAAIVKPKWWYHGHYHQFAQQAITASWGGVKVTSLDMDGRAMNWGVLDTRTLEFEGFNGKDVITT